MARKKKLSLNPKTENFRRENALRGTLKDIRRQAIALGIPFPDVINKDIWALISYINQSNNTPDPSRIDEYDNWIDTHFDEIGIPKNDPIRHPHLRLGYIGERDEEGNIIKRKKIPGIKKTKYKKPRERDENNLVKGTKKSYTWELTKKGLNLERVIRRVQKKFSDANDKSIRLWHRACLREMKKNEN